MTVGFDDVLPEDAAKASVAFGVDPLDERCVRIDIVGRGVRKIEEALGIFGTELHEPFCRHLVGQFSIHQQTVFVHALCAIRHH